MGKEIEIKLAAPDAAALEAVGADARVEAARPATKLQLRSVKQVGEGTVWMRYGFPAPVE